ncbi:MAG: hypothetical protein R3E02_10480 [Blastomonas sp.]
MTMELKPLGRMLVYPIRAIRHAGPLTIRTAAELGSVDWQSDLLGKVTMEIGMGSYLMGPTAGHVTVRLSLVTQEGEPFFFQYISVGEMEGHIAGKSPIWLSGQVEIDPASRHEWLNRVQLVGRGMFTHDPLCQAYDMAYLGDGPDIPSA